MWNMRVTMMPIVIRVVGTVPKALERGLKELDIGRRLIDHPSIVKIGQNTEKSPGYLRTLAITQTPVKDN